MLKCTVIGLAVAFIVGFALQFIKAWIMEIKYQYKKRHHDRKEDWIYNL